MVVVLNRLDRTHQPWAWMRMAQGPGVLRDEPGLLFGKVMGSGADGGFGLRPSPGHQSLLGLFEHQDQAHAFLASPLVQAYRDRAAEQWCAVLQIDSARGDWDGHPWDATHPEQLGAPPDPRQEPVHPLAVLTRASISPSKAMAFWRYAPATQTAMQSAAGCRLAIGLGEAPLLRQCTFSLWDSNEAMLEYAQQGSHRQAAQAAHRQGFFSESLFLRMRLLTHSGAWPSPGRATTNPTHTRPAQP